MQPLEPSPPSFSFLLPFRSRARFQKAVMLHPVQQGALTSLWAGTMPEVLKHNGGVRPIMLAKLYYARR